MEGLGFDRMSIGGRLGAPGSHEFRRDGHLVSLTSLTEGQSMFRVLVHSDTVEVEHLVLDVLTEGVADFLEPFCETLTDRSSEQILHSLIGDLRDAFEKILSGGR
jgi:hypothetical protein